MFQECEIKDFLQENPTLIDNFLRAYHSTGVNLTRENIERKFGSSNIETKLDDYGKP